MYTVYAEELHTGRERAQGTFATWHEAYMHQQTCLRWSVRAVIISE